MSRKSKLILATALFGAALFAASCGGGDNGGTTAGGGSGGSGGGGNGGGGTESTVEGKVLALLDVGGAISGSLRPVFICNLMSDGKAECGPTDLNPNADLDLQYVHEFQNGNVLLVAGNVLYLFDGSQVRRLDTFRSLTSATTNTAAGGVTVPDNAFISRLPNLVMMFNDLGNFVAVTENGTVIRDTGVNPTPAGAACPTVTKAGNTFSISANGNVTSLNRTIQNVLASAGGKFLVYGSDNRLYLRDDPCLPDGQSVSPAPIPNVNDAQMVRVGNDFYIAVNDGVNLYYYRVSGSSSTLVATAPDPTNAFLGGRFDYTLDGEGRLYVAVDTNNDSSADRVDIYHPNNTTGAADANAAISNNVVAMLGFANRALAIDGAAAPNFHDISPNGAVTVLPPDPTLQQHFNNCTDAMNTKAVDGIGTNFIRCLYDQGAAGGNGQRLSSIAFVGGQYRRPNAIVTIAPAPASPPSRAEVGANDILFGANALIVRHAINNRIRLCTTTSTTSPSISCSDTGVLNAAGRPLGFADLDTNNNLIDFYSSYLKSNGSEVFYRNGTTLFVGDIFSTPPTLPITVNNASGGNASFDLNRFAFSFTPVGAPCATQIAYLSSRTANQKTYTIVQPSNACVTRILKVFP